MLGERKHRRRAFGRKKNPWSGKLQGSHPDLLDPTSADSGMSPCRSTPFSEQAGLLADGSSYSYGLPGYPVAITTFVPVHSGGTAPDLHGIPFYAPRHLIAITCWCQLVASSAAGVKAPATRRLIFTDPLRLPSSAPARQTHE